MTCPFPFDVGTRRTATKVSLDSVISSSGEIINRLYPTESFKNYVNTYQAFGSKWKLLLHYTTVDIRNVDI